MSVQAPSALTSIAPMPRRTWSAAWTGAAAIGILLALSAAGHADREAVTVAAPLIFAVAAWQTIRAGRARGLIPFKRPEPSVDPEAVAYRAAFEVLPDPAMLVVGGEPDDFASRRVTVANAAARELLRIPPQGALLVAALRDPEVLEAVEETLFGGSARSAVWESGGAQDRIWRAWTAPLEPLGDQRRALVVLHEETDVRRAERTRADFLANASHELRTPLASLAGFVETLRGPARGDPAVHDKFLAIMSAQTERMRRLVDDLLSLSRVELNEHVPPSGRTDLRLAVMDVCEALAPLAAQREVKLETVLPPDPILLAGERDPLVQVVQNLVDNALNYSPPGARVSVELAAGLEADAASTASHPGAARLSLLTPDREPGRRYAAVRVRDFGRGIDREHLPRLTERFYRVAGQKSGERPGTGLGLAIVRHIVNRHRGGLVVDSTRGEGSTFIVYFPQLEAAASVGQAA